MASLRSENGKSFVFDNLADLTSSSGIARPVSSSTPVPDRKTDHEELSTNDLQHFTELRPLFDPTVDGGLSSSAGQYFDCDLDNPLTTRDTRYMSSSCKRVRFSLDKEDA